MNESVLTEEEFEEEVEKIRLTVRAFMKSTLEIMISAQLGETFSRVAIFACFGQWIKNLEIPDEILMYEVEKIIKVNKL